jgi:hypothetical protein
MAAKVVTLAYSADTNGEATNEVDPIFFRKQDLKKGTLLTNYGRRDPRSTWRVTEFKSLTLLPTGLYRFDKTTEVVHLRDIVVLVRQPHSDAVANRRESSFGSLSYSAIWRIKQ